MKNLKDNIEWLLLGIIFISFLIFMCIIVQALVNILPM